MRMFYWAMWGVALAPWSSEARPQFRSEARPAAERQAQVSGLVYDSIAAAPLSNALVQLVSETDRSIAVSTLSDSLGRFAFASVAQGRYVIGFAHQKLDSLLLRPTVQRVIVDGVGNSVRISLSVPSWRTLSAAYCGLPGQRAEATAIMLGRLRTASGAPIVSDHRAVRARWRDVFIDGSGVRSVADSTSFALQTSDEFALCGLPLESSVTVQAWLNADSTGAVELEVPASGVLLRDLVVATPERLHSAGADAPDTARADSETPRARRRSTATVQTIGYVRDTAGAAIARATVAGPGRDAATRTDSSGRFTLSHAPAGTQTLEVRALGYIPRRIIVDLPDTSSAIAPIVLSRVTNLLSTVPVTARRSFAGFEARRRNGVGLFLDADAIRQRNPWDAADILRQLPGVVIGKRTSFSAKILTKFGKQSCEPSIWIDGVELLSKSKDLDAFVSVESIRAVEVFNFPAEVPRDFAGDPFCGAILFWTRE